MSKKKPVDGQTKDGFETVGYDDFFEDLFGLSLRGLHSIRTLIVNPAEYFDAARVPDWEERFTPSLRIWLGLMAILVGLQFIWAADTSNYMTVVTQLPTALVDMQMDRDGADVDALQNYDMLAAAKRINARNLLIYPFIFIIMFLLLSKIFNPWKQGENFIVRQRYVFGVIVVGSVFGLLATIGSYFIPTKFYQTAGNIQLAITLIIYAVTAYRGPMRHLGNERIGMSIVMTIMMFMTLMIAQIISMLIATWPVLMEIMAL